MKYKTEVYGRVTKDFIKDELPDKLNALGGKILFVDYTANREIMIIYESDE
jgi:hypothetical protein